MTEGIKHDQDKVRYDLITAEMLDALAERLTLGSKKYGDRNWENGLNYSRLYRGALGHLAKWFHGEDIDPEDGGNHIDAALACVGFLATYVRRPELAKFDNRPKRHTGVTAPLPPGGTSETRGRYLSYYGFPPVDSVENIPVSDLSTAEKPLVRKIGGRKIHLATSNGWGRCGAGIRWKPIRETKHSDLVTCNSCKRLMA